MRVTSAAELMRGRRSRLVIVALIFVATAMVLAPYFLNHVSSAAFVNGEIIRVTAPISGSVDAQLPRDGAYIDETRRIDLLEAIAPDSGPLLALESEYEATAAQVDLLDRQLTEIGAMEANLRIRFDAYEEAFRARVAAEYDAAIARLEACRAREVRAAGEAKDAGALAEKDVVSASRLREATALSKETTADCAAANAELMGARASRAAADAGVFIQAGGDDAPYSRQQLERLILRRMDVEAERLKAAIKAERLSGAVSAERERLAKASEYDLQLPEGHVVWAVLARAGTAVIEGQPILELVDCSERFVSVEMSERAVSAIRKGDPASVRLVGTRRWISGRVSQVAGSAARREERLLAAAIPEPSGQRFLVEIAIPSTALTADESNRCHVGRLAEVRFQRFTFDKIFRGRAPREERIARAGS